MNSMNSSILQLHVAGNFLRAPVVDALNPLLQRCFHLHTLNLRDNLIGEVGAINLANGLTCRSGLTHVDIARNRIATDGAKAVAVALGTCQNLKSLCLFYNGIRNTGAEAVAKYLKPCTQ